MEKTEIIQQNGKAEVAINPMSLLDKAISNGIDATQLEKLMDLYDRWAAKNAEKAYNDAMASVQKEIGAVKAKMINRQTNSKYAGILDIDASIRPHYTDKGIAISFDTADSPLPEHVRILAFVTHRDGHKETRHIDIPADGKGAKGGDVMTITHAVMSATTYGQRALLKMIFNIASGEFDDDGNKAGLSKDKRQEAINSELKDQLVDLFVDKESKLNDSQKRNLERIIKNEETASYVKAIQHLKKL